MQLLTSHDRVGSRYRTIGHSIAISPSSVLVGAAEGCDFLIFDVNEGAKDQKIAAFGSSYIELSKGHAGKIVEQ
ncbi:hypothetical protein [Pseudomonas sp. ZB1P45]|uniref:hypothetical protein n=1 Tax=Pseudomonas frigoris TaxID=3398356 RepID=UPI0039EEE61A